MLVSDSMDRNLSLTERFALRVHLVYCTGCRRFRSHLGALREILSRDPWEGQSDETLPGSVLSNAARTRMKAILIGDR